MTLAGGSRRPRWQCSATFALAIALSCGCALLMAVMAGAPCRLAASLGKTGAPSGAGSSYLVAGSAQSGAAGLGGPSAGISSGDSSGTATPRCYLPVKDGPLAQACHLLEDVCVDQRTVILHGSKYHPTADRPTPEPLPVLEPDKRYRHYIFVHQDTGEKDYRYGLPPLQSRPSSVDEPLPYLAQPVFSTCTVPIVYYSHYLVNPAHIFRDNAARLYGALQETPWAQHAKLVLMTPEGLAPPHFARDMMQPLTQTKLETWADFTARLPSQQAPDGSGFLPANLLPSAQPLSWEGGPRRCFKHMYVCMDNINITGWPLHAYGQHLVQHYLSQLPPEQQPRHLPAEALPRRLAPPVMPGRGLGGPPQPGASGDAPSSGGNSSSHAASSSSSGSKEASSSSGSRDQGTGGPGSTNSSSGEGGDVTPVLKVAFHKRSSPERQILNAAELLERCNAWRYTTLYGVEVRAKCWEVELPDLFSGIAAAQAADVFVGAHGANIANAWLMRPGSSVIELTMFEFDETDAHMNLAKRNMMDLDTQVQFWKVLSCDNSSWAPGLLEARGLAAGEPYQDFWPKYRNMVVRWAVLEAALRDIVDTAGDMQQYRQRWAEGRWWWLSTANEAVYAGKDVYQTCRKALAEGRIRY